MPPHPNPLPRSGGEELEDAVLVGGIDDDALADVLEILDRLYALIEGMVAGMSFELGGALREDGVAVAAAVPLELMGSDLQCVEVGRSNRILHPRNSFAEPGNELHHELRKGGVFVNQV